MHPTTGETAQHIRSPAIAPTCGHGQGQTRSGESSVARRHANLGREHLRRVEATTMDEPCMEAHRNRCSWLGWRGAQRHFACLGRTARRPRCRSYRSRVWFAISLNSNRRRRRRAWRGWHEAGNNEERTHGSHPIRGIAPMSRHFLVGRVVRATKNRCHAGS